MNLRNRRLLDILLVGNLILVAVIGIRAMGLQEDVTQLKKTLAIAAERQASRANAVSQSMRELASGIRRIQGQPVAHLSELAATRARAGRMLQKCSQCHKTERLRKLYLMNKEERLETIRKMAKKEDSHVALEESEEILEAFEILSDFHQDQWVTDEQADILEASLILQKCRRCHQSETLRDLYLMEADQRLRTIENIAQQTDSHAGLAEPAKILKAFEVLTASH